jgi:hypothetical protein
MVSRPMPRHTRERWSRGEPVRSRSRRRRRRPDGPFGLDNPNEIFVATDQPFGLIEGTVRRG